jgi:transposase-like protein
MLPLETAIIERYAQEGKEAARKKAADVVEKLKAMKLAKAGELVKEDIEETLHDMDFPREHWRSLRTDNPLERIMREIRCRTRVVGASPDGNSALMLVAARLRQVAATSWGSKRYLDMHWLKEKLAKEDSKVA